MEAAAAASALPARLRARGFERECERLRPLGEAYLLRRFGASLNRADAEDAVAEVLIRLHRRAAAGRPPDNLRAAFFTSVRNAAIDQLRSRAARPTVALEAAANAPAPNAGPAEWAEGREDAVRLQEALARMRSNYREAIMLRFGIGMTVPEMATHLGISLPAAKKLVLRATAQVRSRMASIEDAEFCSQMRELVQRSLFEKEVSGIASEQEAEALRAHFSHCGSCKSFLAALHDSMHDLGAAAVFGFAAGDHFGAVDHLSRWAAAALDGAQAGAGRVRHLAYRAAAPLSGSDSPAGAILSTGQKVAAICTAGAASAATCLLTGAVGPGIGVAVPAHQPPPPPPAHVRQLSAPLEASSEEVATLTSPTTTAEPAQPSGGGGDGSPPANTATEAPPPAPAAPVQSSEATAPSEFGVESSPSPSAAAEPAPPPASTRSTGGSGGELGGGSSGSAAAGESGAGVGFHG